MNTKIFYVFILLWGFLGQNVTLAQQDDEAKPEPTSTANVTIAVLNSDKPYHVAFVRYYDKNGDILLNTSEEFKIDIAKSPRFKTGSTKRAIPIYPKADYFEVTVTNCTNMHENRFYVNELKANNDQATFIFRGIVEDLVTIEFAGIQDNKPCTFQIKGANTNVIFYADYSNVKKVLPEEARNKDISVEVSETSLYKYKIDKVEKDKKGKIVKVTVSLVAEEK
jgi:hypothetical protein